MEEKDILKRLIKNDSLFNMIGVIVQQYDILPNNKEHIGAYIEYQDIQELRDGFVEELSYTIVDWIYSSEKYEEIKKKLVNNGKSEAAASQYIGRKAKNKFRANKNSENVLIQGQMGELLLYHFIQKCMKAVPLLRKMNIATSSDHERFGADAIHFKIENDKNIIILGEAKTYTSKYKFNEAFSDALDSILNTYNKHRSELGLYVHEDFLDDEMNVVAEKYLNNTLKSVEIHLVSIVTYNELSKIDKIDENTIRNNIKKIIEDRYRNYDKNKIDMIKNPILSRITYIVFPVWDLKELAEKFQKLI
ncbi:HamA C-terminal domain-containing protein [Mogibacterium timidum]